MTNNRQATASSDAVQLPSSSPVLSPKRFLFYSIRIVRPISRLLWAGGLHFATAILSSAILIGGVLVWQLRDGHIKLDVMLPYLTEAIAQNTNGLEITARHMDLKWTGWERKFEFQISGLTAKSASGAEIINFTNAALQFSFRSLLQGVIAPTRIVVSGSKVSVTRKRDQSFSLNIPGFGAVEKSNATTPNEFVSVIMDIFRPPRQVKDHNSTGMGTSLSTSIFEGISIRDARVEFFDEVSQASIIAENVGVELSRRFFGLDIDLALSANLGASQIQLDSQIRLPYAGGQLGQVRFEGLWLPDLVQFAPQLKVLNELDLIADGRVSFEHNGLGDIPNVDFEVRTGRGRFQIPNVLELPIAIETAYARGRVEDNFGRVHFEETILDTAGPVLSFRGDLSRIRSPDRRRFSSMPPNLKARLNIQDLNLADLERYWPERVAPAARKWILDHIESGFVKSAGLDMDFDGSSFGTEDRNPGPFQLDFNFTKLKARYFRNMESIVGANGWVSINQDSLELNASDGRIGALAINEIKVTMAKILDPIPMTTIQFVTNGSIPETLRLMDQDPLRFAQKMSIPFDKVQGAVASRVMLSFPTSIQTKLTDIKVAAVANLEEVAWPGFRDGLDVDRGTFQLKVDQERLSVEGRARLSEIPVEVMLISDLGNQADVIETIRLAALLNTNNLIERGLPMEGVLEGILDVETDIRTYRDGKMEADVVADLRNSQLEIPGISYKKAIGEPGTINTKISFSNTDKTGFDITNIVLTTSELALLGSAQVSPIGSLNQFQIDRIKWGYNDFSAVIRPQPDKTGYVMDVRGRSLDLAPYFEQTEPSETLNFGPISDVPDISMQAQLDSLLIGKKTQLQSVQGALSFKNSKVMTLDATAAIGANKALLFMSMTPTRFGRALKVTSNDAGSVVMSALPEDRIKGGDLIIEANLYDFDPVRPTTGKLTISNFTLERAPILARIIQLGSFLGIVDMLNGGGLSFEALDAPFTYDDGVLSVNHAMASGLSLGITMSGQINYRNDQVSLKGSIIPAFKLNSLLGKIPLVGALLAGEDGELFGVSYGLEGDLNTPKITVNPMSALTPGVLRRILPFVGDTPTSKPQAPLEKLTD